MARRSRIYSTDEHKADIWDRWERGESMSSIGRVFELNSSSIYPLLSRTGGIRPAQRRRSCFALSLPEREEMSRGLAHLFGLTGLLKRPASRPYSVRLRGGGDECFEGAACAHEGGRVGVGAVRVEEFGFLAPRRADVRLASGQV